MKRSKLATVTRSRSVREELPRHLRGTTQRRTCITSKSRAMGCRCVAHVSRAFKACLWLRRAARGCELTGTGRTIGKPLQQPWHESEQDGCNAVLRTVDLKWRLTL